MKKAIDYQQVGSRLQQLVRPGLISGLGEPNPGEMCIEAAVSLALGEEFSDKPSCVAEEDRQFAIRLNDAPWSSAQARAEGMLPLGIAQLGTRGKDRKKWVNYVVEQTIKRILPKALRAAAKKHSKQEHREALEKTARQCEKEGSREAALKAHAAAYTACAAAYAAAARVATGADAAARAAARAADAADAAVLAADRAADADEILKEAVQIALEAYQKYPHRDNGE